MTMDEMLKIWKKHSIIIKTFESEKWVAGANAELKYIQKMLRKHKLIDENGIPLKGEKNDFNRNKASIIET